ncbi:MAG TPA: small basic protein [Phycisphaerae bacterium]|nr:small basic protein [Phycisphaerae bacterium]
MSMDRSLKTRSSLARHRNVLSRAERIARLAGEERFDATKNRPTGLPKVANRKAHVGGKSVKKEGAEAEKPAEAPKKK